MMKVITENLNFSKEVNLKIFPRLINDGYKMKVFPQQVCIEHLTTLLPSATHEQIKEAFEVSIFIIFTIKEFYKF